MDLKDVVLSALAEVDRQVEKEDPKIDERLPEEPSFQTSMRSDEKEGEPIDPKGEREFLENVRERLLVLFEGFQSPNNDRLEAKIDLTVNFLEYLLATIDERLATLRKS